MKMTWFGLVALAVTVLACDTEKTPPRGDSGKSDVIETLDVPGDLPAEAAADQGSEATADAAGETASDAGPPKPYVSARKTAVPLDLADGENSYAILGKSWVIENDLVRFVFQDGGVSVLMNVYGGSLVDADLRREPGEDGRDQFRELFPMVGLRVSSVAKVEVVEDGTSGERAVLRFTGTDQKLGVLDVIDNLAGEIGATIRTDYILEPDVPWLKVRTEVENPKNTALSGLTIGDFISFGGASRVFRPEGGFTGEPIESSALISTGRGASYGYTMGTGMIAAPYQELNSAITMLGAGFEVPAKGKASYDRYFVVGRGDVASVLDTVQELRGVGTATLSGTVIDEAGSPLSGAVITVFADQGADPAGDGTALTQAYTGKSGAYSLNLPAGKYDVVASAEGRLRVIKSGVDISQFNADFQMDAAGRVGLDIQERDSKGDSLGHIPAKVSFECLAGAEKPWDELGENERYGLCAVVFSPNGGGEYPVRPGHYKVTVSRGIEYEKAVIEDFEVKAGETVWIEEDLVRTLDTSGYLSGDFHQHTLGSIDSEVIHEEKVIENLAEGVEIAAVTDHDNITSYGPAIAALGAWDLISSIDGDEVSVNGKGHFNMFEPTGDAETLVDYIGSKFYSGKTVPEVFEAMRKIEGVRVIQMNHPRSFDAYLSWIKYDPVTGSVHSSEATMAWDFDSMEVKDSVGDPELFTADSDPDIQSQAKYGSMDIPVMRDWFSMLNQGMPVCAMGNSDAHNRNDGVGYSRNFLRLDTDKPSEADTKSVLDAILAQRNVVSNGPFLKVLVKDPSGFGNIEVMGLAEMTRPVQGEVVADLTVSAATWIDVSRLEVYANGRPVHLKEVLGVLIEDELAADTDPLWMPIPLPNTTPGDIERLHTTVHLFPNADTWYVFLVKGSGDLSPVGNGAPFAYTNPIYVDADEDGKFTASGVAGN